MAHRRQPEWVEVWDAEKFCPCGSALPYGECCADNTMYVEDSEGKPVVATSEQVDAALDQLFGGFTAAAQANNRKPSHKRKSLREAAGG